MTLLGILAQDSDWDEILLVAITVVLFGALLLLARRRAIGAASRDRESEPS